MLIFAPDEEATTKFKLTAGCVTFNINSCDPKPYKQSAPESQELK